MNVAGQSFHFRPFFPCKNSRCCRCCPWRPVARGFERVAAHSLRRRLRRWRRAVRLRGGSLGIFTEKMWQTDYRDYRKIHRPFCYLLKGFGGFSLCFVCILWGKFARNYAEFLRQFPWSRVTCIYKIGSNWRWMWYQTWVNHYYMSWSSEKPHGHMAASGNSSNFSGKIIYQWMLKSMFPGEKSWNIWNIINERPYFLIFFTSSGNITCILISIGHPQWNPKDELSISYHQIEHFLRPTHATWHPGTRQPAWAEELAEGANSEPFLV